MAPTPRRYLREVPPTERADAARRVESWDYPRGIASTEVDLGTWIKWGEQAFVWYVPVDGHDGVLSVHACTSQDARGEANTERNALSVQIIGELLGARILVAGVPIESEGIRGMLARRGWTLSDHGCAMALGS